MENGSLNNITVVKRVCKNDNIDHVTSDEKHQPSRGAECSFKKSRHEKSSEKEAAIMKDIKFFEKNSAYLYHENFTLLAVISWVRVEDILLEANKLESLFLSKLVSSKLGIHKDFIKTNNIEQIDIIVILYQYLNILHKCLNFIGNNKSQVYYISNKSSNCDIEFYNNSNNSDPLLNGDESNYEWFSFKKIINFLYNHSSNVDSHSEDVNLNISLENNCETQEIHSDPKLPNSTKSSVLSKNEEILPKYAKLPTRTCDDIILQASSSHFSKDKDNKSSEKKSVNSFGNPFGEGYHLSSSQSTEFEDCKSHLSSEILTLNPSKSQLLKQNSKFNVTKKEKITKPDKIDKDYGTRSVVTTEAEEFSFVSLSTETGDVIYQNTTPESLVEKTTTYNHKDQFSQTSISQTTTKQFKDRDINLILPISKNRSICESTTPENTNIVRQSVKWKEESSSYINQFGSLFLEKFKSGESLFKSSVLSGVNKYFGSQETVEDNVSHAGSRFSFNYSLFQSSSSSINEENSEDSDSESVLVIVEDCSTNESDFDKYSESYLSEAIYSRSQTNLNVSNIDWSVDPFNSDVKQNCPIKNVTIRTGAAIIVIPIEAYISSVCEEAIQTLALTSQTPNNASVSSFFGTIEMDLNAERTITTPEDISWEVSSLVKDFNMDEDNKLHSSSSRNSEVSTFSVVSLASSEEEKVCYKIKFHHDEEEEEADLIKRVTESPEQSLDRQVYSDKDEIELADGGESSSSASFDDVDSKEIQLLQETEICGRGTAGVMEEQTKYFNPNTNQIIVLKRLSNNEQSANKHDRTETTVRPSRVISYGEIYEQQELVSFLTISDTWLKGIFNFLPRLETKSSFPKSEYLYSNNRQIMESNTKFLKSSSTKKHSANKYDGTTVLPNRVINYGEIYEQPDLVSFLTISDTWTRCIFNFKPRLETKSSFPKSELLSSKDKQIRQIDKLESNLDDNSMASKVSKKRSSEVRLSFVGLKSLDISVKKDVTPNNLELTEQLDLLSYHTGSHINIVSKIIQELEERKKFLSKETKSMNLYTKDNDISKTYETSLNMVQEAIRIAAVSLSQSSYEHQTEDLVEQMNIISLLKPISVPLKMGESDLFTDQCICKLSKVDFVNAIGLLNSYQMEAMLKIDPHKSKIIDIQISNTNFLDVDMPQKACTFTLKDKQNKEITLSLKTFMINRLDDCKIHNLKEHLIKALSMLLFRRNQTEQNLSFEPNTMILRSGTKEKLISDDELDDNDKELIKRLSQLESPPKSEIKSEVEEPNSQSASEEISIKLIKPSPSVYIRPDPQSIQEQENKIFYTSLTQYQIKHYNVSLLPNLSKPMENMKKPSGIINENDMSPMYDELMIENDLQIIVVCPSPILYIRDDPQVVHEHDNIISNLTATQRQYKFTILPATILPLNRIPRQLEKPSSQPVNISDENFISDDIDIILQKASPSLYNAPDPQLVQVQESIVFFLSKEKGFIKSITTSAILPKLSNYDRVKEIKKAVPCLAIVSKGNLEVVSFSGPPNFSIKEQFDKIYKSSDQNVVTSLIRPQIRDRTRELFSGDPRFIQVSSENLIKSDKERKKCMDICKNVIEEAKVQYQLDKEILNQENIQRQSTDKTNRFDEKHFENDLKFISIDKKEIEKRDLSTPLKMSNKFQENILNFISNPIEVHRIQLKVEISTQTLSLHRYDTEKKLVDDAKFDSNYEESFADENQLLYQEDAQFFISDVQDLAYKQVRKETAIQMLSLLSKNIGKRDSRSMEDLLYQEDTQFFSHKPDLAYKRTKKENDIKSLTLESNEAKNQVEPLIDIVYQEYKRSKRYKMNSLRHTSSRTFLF